MLSHRHLRSLSSRAFTLIELLVVIVILGILMAVAVPTFLSQQNKAKDSKTEQQLTTAYKAIRSGLAEYNNAYPSTASIVSVISQSEPELTVSSGSCNASTNDKQVVVDNVTSSATKLSLYAKSSSGTWWNLAAPAAGAPVFSKLGSCNGPLSTATVTAAGGEITDATRSSGVQGDGLTSDSSYGIWETSTNLCTNGGFETDVSGWAIFQPGTTITRVTGGAKFGSAAAQVTLDGSRNWQGVFYSYAYTAGVRYTLSAWVNGPAGSFLSIGYSANDQQYTLTGSWQKITYTWTAAGGDNRLYITEDTKQQTMSFLLDGVQIEQNPLVTPYLETNGATASRGQARIQAPGSVLNTTQGWVALRVATGWPSSTPTSDPDSSPTLFGWYGGGGGPIMDFSFNGANQLQFRRALVTGGSGESSTTVSFSAGQPFTAIFAWTATKIAASFNGGPFVSVSNTLIPGSMPAQFDIGSLDSAGSNYRELNGRIFWFVAGTGTLSDSDAATINNWGNQDPTTQYLPAAAQATLAWSADTAQYVTGT